MKDLNTVTIIGRLTRDAELKTTATGYEICNISIAVNRSVKRNDQWTDEASFFDVVLFGKRAESLTPYLLKGKQIAVQGELSQDRWEKDGKKRSRVQIIAQDIQLIGSKPQQATTASSAELGGEPDSVDDDDIPF